MDALSEVLKVLRFNSAIFFNARFTAPWCLASPQAEAVARQVNAGSERLLFYHFFVEGSCTVKLDDVPPLRVLAGDIILFPQGDAHTMASSGVDGPRPLLDVLASEVGIIGIFSDWPATVTYYASCMGLK